MSNGHKGSGRITAPARRRALALALCGILVAATLLAGCLDTLLPAGESKEERDETGLLRVWIATSPGAIGREFAHYNISYGPAVLFTDIHLTNWVPLQSERPTLDLARMERDKLTASLGQVFTPEGPYYGVAATVERATVAIERIVGSNDGQPVVRAEENPIQHNTAISSYRAEIWVLGGRTTDVFLEVDLQRSLQRGDGGNLHHTTILTRVTVLIDGNRLSQFTYDGGRSQLDPNDPLYAELERQRQAPLSEVPIVRFRAHDIETDRQLYSNLPGTPSKRLNQALGLHQELRFDASSSASRYEKGGVTIPIVEYTWNWGDGTTSTGPRTTKAYSTGGIYDIVLTVRDEENLVANDHLTVFVPYTSEQAASRDHDAVTGLLSLPSLAADTPGVDNSARHRFTFPAELQGGQLRLGGYHVEAVARDPLGGSYSGLLDVTLRAESGHFKATTDGAGPWTITSAAVPAWRGSLPPWVTPELVVTLELRAGLLVSYDVVVEPLYYHNLSRGIDPHATHIHSPWTLGPSWANLHWDGTVARDD